MAFVVGTVIGTGIYVTPPQVAKMAPEPWQNLLLWAAGGLFALCGAVVYARLSFVWPDSGGAFVYLRNCYGEWVGSLLLAADVLLARPAAVGAMAALLGQIWGLDQEGTVGLAAATLLALTAGQLLGRQATGGMQVVLTALKMVPLLLVAGLGATHGSAPPAPATSEPVLWASGFLAVLWAYDGWYNITILGGEVERPEVNLRRSLVGGVVIVTIVYLGLNWLLLAKVSRAEIISQAVPFVVLLGQGMDGQSLGLALKAALSVAVLATLNGTLACGPSMLAAGGLGGSELSSVRRSTLLFSGWSFGLLLLFAGLPSQFGLFARLSGYTVVVVAGLSGLTVSCLFHLPRFGFSADLPTKLAALGFLLIDVSLMVLLAREQGALALGGTLSVLAAGSLLYLLRRAHNQVGSRKLEKD
jgi:APA family basic amino acid/polyamine antiporter